MRDLVHPLSIRASALKLDNVSRVSRSTGISNCIPLLPLINILRFFREFNAFNVLSCDKTLCKPAGLCSPICICLLLYCTYIHLVVLCRSFTSYSLEQHRYAFQSSCNYFLFTGATQKHLKFCSVCFPK